MFTYITDAYIQSYFVGYFVGIQSSHYKESFCIGIVALLLGVYQPGPVAICSC